MYFKLVLPICGLPFYFSDNVFWRAKDFHFNKVQFTNVYGSWFLSSEIFAYGLLLYFLKQLIKTQLTYHAIHPFKINSSMDFFFTVLICATCNLLLFFFLMFIHCLTLSPSLSLCSEHCFSITHPWLCGDSSGNC